MERDQLVRKDFPKAHGTTGFDIDSVGAHLAAVAAHVAALEARIAALEVERDTLRQQLAEAREHESGPSGLPEPGDNGQVGLPESGQTSPDGPAEAGEEEVAARLFASKLAMEGKARDTIVMQLAAEHEIEDPSALVDDVLARLA